MQTKDSATNGYEHTKCSRGKLHEVFADSFDNKECFTKKFILKKLDYTHWNPCRGKWNLAPSPEGYVHSSAGFYFNGVQGIFAVDNIMAMMDIDLSKRI